MPGESISHYLNSLLYFSNYQTILALGEFNVAVEGVNMPKFRGSYVLKSLIKD